MTATFIHDGDAVDHIPTVDLPCGAVVVLGTMVGITPRPIPANALGSLAVTGVWDLPAVGGQNAPVGTPAFWDVATQMATLDSNAPGVVRAGLLIQAVTATASTLRVLLGR